MYAGGIYASDGAHSCRHTWPYKTMHIVYIYIYLLHWLVTFILHHSLLLIKQECYWFLANIPFCKLEFWPAASGILLHVPSVPCVPYIIFLVHGVGWVGHSSPCVFMLMHLLSGCPWHISSGEKLCVFFSLVYGCSKTRFTEKYNHSESSFIWKPVPG